MRSIAEIIAEAQAEGRPTISVEFFPPKTEVGQEQLRRTLAELRRSPVPLDFVSVTYGAGGSTRDKTRDLVVEINDSESYPTMAHLTCMGHTKAELTALLDDYEAAGVRNILALAGDLPADGSPITGDFTYAHELVDLIRSRGEGRSIAVAAHPEMHPRSTVRDDDRAYLAEKLAKADFAITQFFYDVDHYVQMVAELSEVTPGGKINPILPGIMPLTNPVGVKRMAEMSGATFPHDLAERIEAATVQAAIVQAAAGATPAAPGTAPVLAAAQAADSAGATPTAPAPADDAGRAVAIDAAVDLCVQLLDHGAPGLHIYGLNRSETVLAIIEALVARGAL